MKPSAAAVKQDRKLDEIASELKEIRDQLTLTLGLVAAIAEAVSPQVAQAGDQLRAAYEPSDLWKSIVNNLGPSEAPPAAPALPAVAKGKAKPN